MTTYDDTTADRRTAYDDTTAAVLLDAGAILPLGGTGREDADTLTVRTYTHPALGERAVVRLVPGTLGEAEDLALDFLGLARTPETPEVGQVRKEALGFPAWALVNDPANGHHALALVRDIERLARQAKSRPGIAKEGFEELGTRLGRAVPHFLPTFYEQAARVFLQHENTTYAAAFFGKAREAERVHALTVDEERQRAVFLEFAFAGALTVKALREHVKALTVRLDPAAAWAQFRQLTVERCAAGMPPYASLPQDARGLIRATGLDRVTEECALVADLLASPAAVRAPASFWNTYRTTLVVLAERRPEVRRRLLEIMPAGLGRTVEDDEFWLALLTECGADLLLTGEAGAAADGVDAADWLSRWALHRKHNGNLCGRSPATLALVARMAPRLRALGRPVDLVTGRWHAGADLDLLDLCVAEGVPLVPPRENQVVFLGLDRWLRDTRPGRRDLTASAASPWARPLLHAEIGTQGGQRPHRDTLEGLAAHPALGDVLRAWLEEAAGELSAAVGLPAARAALERLRPFRSVAPRVAPAAVARVAAHDAAPLLGRTLRAGIPDELGWPALEEAMRRIKAETKPDRDEGSAPHVTEAWPALIVSRGHKVFVVGPTEILLDHDLRLPVTPGHRQRPAFRYTDGQLLVMWRQGNQQFGYWSGRPAEVFPLGGEQLPHYWYGRADAGSPSIPLPGGGRATGGRTLYAGDTALPARRPVLGDGTTYWRQGRQGRQQVWTEYDPATGAQGRASLPAFLRDGDRADAPLHPAHCEVLPLQPGLENSPFGTDGTILGRWVSGDDTHTFAGTPDGRTVALPTGRGRAAVVALGALRLPGGAEPVVAATHRQLVLYAADDTSAAGELGAVTPMERGGEFAAGTPFVPPVAFWHALRPRDERSSAALRTLTDERAAALVRAAAEALAERQARIVAAGKATAGTAAPGTGTTSGAGAEPAVPTAEEVLRDLVARELPELSDRRLGAGVASLLRAVLRLVQSTADFVAPPPAATPPDRTPPHRRRVRHVQARTRRRPDTARGHRRAGRPPLRLVRRPGALERAPADPGRQPRAVGAPGRRQAAGAAVPGHRRRGGLAQRGVQDPGHRLGVAVAAGRAAAAGLPRRVPDRDRRAPRGAAPAVRVDRGGAPGGARGRAARGRAERAVRQSREAGAGGAGAAPGGPYGRRARLPEPRLAPSAGALARPGPRSVRCFRGGRPLRAGAGGGASGGVPRRGADGPRPAGAGQGRGALAAGGAGGAHRRVRRRARPGPGGPAARRTPGPAHRRGERGHRAEAASEGAR
ncbi:hypothetical protein OG616_04590 [Streptomyces antibioticus]|nr:hypothetical protein [Streptomyces antibioticus]MCX5167292.1 hypothetical protein [Streptomyces antibioticus]